MTKCYDGPFRSYTLPKRNGNKCCFPEVGEELVNGKF